jgi:hypothetical protein
VYEPSCSVKGKEFLDQPSHCHLLHGVDSVAVICTASNIEDCMRVPGCCGAGMVTECV